MTDTPTNEPKPTPAQRGVVAIHPASESRNGRVAAAAPAAVPAPDQKSGARARQTERTWAKNAMVASMGALVLTGYMAARGGRKDKDAARMAHMLAGVALMGASYWHTTLYAPRAKSGRT